MAQPRQECRGHGKESAEAPNEKIMASRLEFVKAIKRSPYNNPKRDCDYVPAMELIGIFAAHASVSKMHAEGKLEAGPAAFLNGSIALHAFNVWHCCSHEALSAHNEEHQAFENMVTRLSGILVGFADADVAQHKRHHRYTNTQDDPDLYLTGPLPSVGEALAALFTAELEPPPGMAYEDFAFEALLRALMQTLHGREATSRLGEALLASFSGARQICLTILGLMFARYPHIKGRGLVGDHANEIDSFYDTTWRGQGQVDLWMMGEGWHHGHHAVTDVNYTVLPRVGADVEASSPAMRAEFRGNGDIAALEAAGDEMPPHLEKDSSEPCQRGWQRTMRVRAEIDRVTSAGGTPEAMQSLFVALAEGAIDNALYVTTTADCALLRDLHQKLGFRSMKSDGPLPIEKWHETAISAGTQEILRQQAAAIKEEVLGVARAAGAALAPSAKIARKSDIKDCYLEFYRALGCVLVDSEQFWRHLQEAAAAFPAPRGCAASGAGPEQLLVRVRKYLESPLPRDSLRPQELKRPVGSLDGMNQLIGNVLGLRPPASRL